MKLIRTVLYDEFEEIIGMAETEVDNITDLERHLEHWHNLKSVYKRHEAEEEARSARAEEVEGD